MGVFGSHKLLGVIGVVALGIGLSFSVGHTRPRLIIHPVSFCPYQTPEEWQRFLERYADDPMWVHTCEDSPCDDEAYGYARDNVAAVFSACAPFIARDERVAKCTANLRRFVPAWMKQHDHRGYGFTVENAKYLHDQEAADKPAGMMTPPAAILAALPSRTAVEEAARRTGLKYLTHDSAIEGIRTFIFNPDRQGRFDQWLLLNLEAKKSRAATTMPLSVLTVQKKDANGHRLARVRLHFRDYGMRQTPRGFEVSLNPANSGKCYSCHGNGTRQLIARHTHTLVAKPVAGEVDSKDFAYERLMEFNRRLRSYGTPDWDGKITPEDFGPALGAEQGCTDCHNGRSRAAINVATSETQLEKKVYDELSMPYDTGLQGLVERSEMRRPPLSPHEEKLLRKAFEAHEDILSQLRESRLPKLKSWLLETPCR